MVARRPAVRINGRWDQLPVGDTLLGGVGLLYPKTYAAITSGTFTLPATALPDVTLLVVAGGGGGNAGGDGGSTIIEDADENVIVAAEGATSSQPGRGGGVAASRKGGPATSPGNAATAGLYGWGCGGATAEWTSPGSGLPGGNAASGSGDGGGGNTAQNTISAGGHGGGVVIARVALVPGDTYTHSVGAGGTAGAAGGAGGSGRAEYHYQDTVP